MSGNFKYGEAVNYNIYLESYFLDPLGIIANIIFEVENHGFYFEKPFATFLYFVFGDFVFFS